MWLESQAGRKVAVGRNSQQRRAARKRREERRGHQRASRDQGASRAGKTWWSKGAGSSGEIQLIVTTGGSAAASGEREVLEEVVSALEGLAQISSYPAIGVVVADSISEELEAVFERGWMPAELVRTARRQHGQHHGDLLVTAIAAGEGELSKLAGVPMEWARQLEDLDVRRWWGLGGDWVSPLALRIGLAWSDTLRVALEALGLLMSLPAIAQLEPPPSKWTTASMEPGLSKQADDPVLAKIRGLLAKAESTSFEAEAEALTAKAQELMARHSIDAALASAAVRSRSRPSARRIGVDDPYATAKSCLLAGVAAANGVRCVWYEHFAMMALIGFESDLEMVEVLFTSLLVQASRSMLSHGSVVDSARRSRTRSFRQSFLLAFGSRIRERLEQAARDAQSQAVQDFGASLVPVLASRMGEVDDMVGELFPSLIYGSGPSVTSEAGWSAGRGAAELAILGPDAEALMGAAGI